MTNKLLPCPFCGHDDQLYPAHHFPGTGPAYAIDCLRCGIDFTPREGMDVAAAWNRRASHLEVARLARRQVSGNHTPTPWRVRSPERNGEIADHFVIADDVNGYPYDAEILGEDEYRDQSGGLARKLADCNLIVTAVNAFEANQSEIARLREALSDLAEAARNACNAAQHPPLTDALFNADAALSPQP